MVWIMNKEIEKKFTCDKDKVMTFFQNLKSKKIDVNMKFINQVYMYKKNASVVWNTKSMSWDVRLYNEDTQFSLRAKKDEVDLINSLVNKYPDNLVLSKDISVRLRKSKLKNNESVEFTIKFPSDNKYMQYEFEYSIEEYDFLDYFFEHQKTSIKKTRYMFDWNYKIVELDIFINSPHIVLEVEFDSIEEMEKYSFDGLPILDETNLSNKTIAFSNI